MSFDYDPTDGEFPSTKLRSLREQCAAMTDAELAHQLTKEYDSLGAVDAMMREATSRMLKRFATLADLVVAYGR